MTSRSIVLGTAAVLLMSAATPLQIGLSPTAAYAQEITLDAAMAGNPSEFDAQQLRERIKVLRDAIENGTLEGSNRQAAQQKIKAYREVLQGIRAERKEAKQDNGQAEQPAEGERTQRQPDANAEQQQAEQNQEQRKAEREAERQAQREAQQQRKAEREAEREAERQAQREAQQQRKAEREAEREAERQTQREAQQQRKAEREAERQAQREAQQAEQRETEQPQAEQQGQGQQQAQQNDGSALTREMTAALRDNRPASELDQAELRDRMQALRAAMQSGALPNDQRRAVQARIQADREVVLARRAERMEDTTTEQPQQRDQRARGEDRPQQEVDRRAREIIADNRPASDLDNNVLRERLTNNRELLATDQLSGAERQQLREQLREDREELRARVAARQEEQEEQEEARAPESDDSEDQTRDRSRDSDNRMRGRDVSRIIEERTPSDQLTERELEERVRVLSRALKAGNITVRQAEVARLLIDRDRDELRGRLYAERDRRRDRRRRGSYDDVFIEFEVGYRPPPVIYAAEAMPRDIQMQLVAPPLYQTQRAYSPQEIATNHDVRETMPGIEIDTLNFDFGSAEVRPEEIEKLDEIGMVIESIVAERPNEVFLIEGHTDAVGSDPANDALSQQRALAVVEALLDYFIIDPENLQTVGLGERYLKIQTPEPEEENRRVTVRRITPLLAGRG